MSPEFYRSKLAADVDEAEKGLPGARSSLDLPKIKSKNEGASQPRTQPGSKNELSKPFARFCADNALIWKHYMDRAMVRDKELVNATKSDLNSLLIFATLFSAIVVAFLRQIRKELHEDRETTNSLLKIIIQNQLNMTALPTTLHSESATSLHWINGLWFCSAALALMCAFEANVVQIWMRFNTSNSVPAVAPAGTTWREVASHHRPCRPKFDLKFVTQKLSWMIQLAFLLFAVGFLILVFTVDARVGVAVLVLVLITATPYINFVYYAFYNPDSPPLTSLFDFLVVTVPSPPLGTLSDEALKAQVLVQLLTDSGADSNVILDTVRAIAGLPTIPDIQKELYRTSVIAVLSRGLSNCINGEPVDPDAHNAYRHAILQLVPWTNTGKPDIARDEFNSVLAKMMENGQSLHHSICDLRNSEICETALCVNARVHSIFHDYRRPAVSHP